MLELLFYTRKFQMSDLDAELFEAVKGNNIEEVKNLIAEGADVNAAHRYEFFCWTPLHLAASKNYPKIAHALLEQDSINVNAKDKFAKTPLHLATMHNNKEIVVTLLEQKEIDIYTKDSSGRIPLDYAYDNDIIAALKAKEAVAEEHKSENMPLYFMTDKETQSDKLTLLDEDENYTRFSDFEQFTQSDQLF